MLPFNVFGNVFVPGQKYAIIFFIVKYFSDSVINCSLGLGSRIPSLFILYLFKILSTLSYELDMMDAEF